MPTIRRRESYTNMKDIHDERMVERMKRGVVITVAAVAFVGILALAGCSGSSKEGTTVVNAATEHVITVTANNDVKVVPDKARVTVSVSNQADTAADCQETNAQTANAVIDALVAAGVAEKSIQTTNVNLYPMRDYSGMGTPTIIGYEMTTTLSVSDLAIADIGSILQDAVAAGATDVGGIQYYSSTYDAAYADALRAAIDAAGEKAQVIATASKVSIGGIVNVTEGYQNTAYRYETGSNYLYAAADMEAASSKAMPGEIEITAQVTVSFAIV